MTDTRPHRDTGPPGIDDEERPTLLAFLNYLREAVIAKAQGLADQQARTPGVPSGTSLLGLVKHLTAAEHHWFVRSFEGADTAPLDLGMELTDEDAAEDLITAYREAVARSNAIVEACDDLSRPCARAAGTAAEVRSLRWVLVHMIEETARHAGHADILREQADGAVGR
ncbi:DinB family protein [Streptomyces sioyaensis]|uniref:DinB family protein n=1 Tax=Streptomyces sioyaensis TaxID=67364 RepID=UPI0037AF2C70